MITATAYITLTLVALSAIGFLIACIRWARGGSLKPATLTLVLPFLLLPAGLLLYAASPSTGLQVVDSLASILPHGTGILVATFYVGGGGGLILLWEAERSERRRRKARWDMTQKAFCQKPVNNNDHRPSSQNLKAEGRVA